MTRKFKEQHLFEIENFCNIINNFTVIFDQLNAPFVNTSIRQNVKVEGKLMHPDF